MQGDSTEQPLAGAWPELTAIATAEVALGVQISSPTVSPAVTSAPTDPERPPTLRAITMTPSFTYTASPTATLTPTVTPSPTPTESPSPTPTVPFAILQPRNGQTVSPGSVVIQGTAPLGSRVEVLSDNTLLGSSETATDGTWRLVLRLPEPGRQLLEVRAVGSATVSPPTQQLTLNVAETLSPVTGGASSGNDPSQGGRIWGALLALLLVAGGFSLVFAGRVWLLRRKTNL
ncbi:MAG: hypothetical protein HC915_10325 [Anaerolineae bacterium]|nr:hypothetical protein [Anaerolineae bacterium]